MFYIEGTTSRNLPVEHNEFSTAEQAIGVANFVVNMGLAHMLTIYDSEGKAVYIVGE